MIKAKEVLNLLEDITPAKVKNFIEKFASNLETKTQLKVDGSVGSQGLMLRSYVPFNEKSVSFGKVQDNFSDYGESKLEIPLKNLEVLYGAKFNSSGSLFSMKNYLGYLHIPSNFPRYGPTEYGPKEIRLEVSVCCVKAPNSYQLVVMISLSLEVTDIDKKNQETLLDAIADVFLGYKKLVNQFNNKPTKKTNADW